MAPNVDEIDYQDTGTQTNLFTTLRKRWEYVLFGLCLGVGLAALYYFTATPMYQSEIEILVGQRSSEVTNSGTINSANVSGDGVQEDQLATHMQLLVSRKLLANAIESGKLRDIESFRQALLKGVNPIDHVLDHLSVKRGGEGKARDAMVLRASFRDANPEDAAKILMAVFDAYREYVESHGENSSEQAVKLIEDARDTHEIELSAAESEYRNFLQSVPALLDGEKVQDVHKERMTKLETELNTVRNTLAEQQSRLEVIESFYAQHERGSKDTFNFLALLSQKEVERLKLFLDMTRGEVQSEAFQAEQPMRQEAARVQYNRLLELIQKEQALSDAFGASHPLVDIARKEIETTRQFLEKNAPSAAEVTAKKLDPVEMLKTYVLLLRNDIAELEKRKAILVEDSEKEMGLAKAVENSFMKGNALKARLNRAQARYDQVILRLQELKLSRSYAGFSTDLLSVPEPAQKPSWPNLPILIVLGAFMGLGLGTMMAFAADLLDATFTSADDLEHAVGATIIAHVPRFAQKKLKPSELADAKVSPAVVSFHFPRSAEAEIYRVARTSLLISNRKGAVRTMMMTSPQPGDGKSTTISNLAVSFARAGQRVLIIDADLRRPTISKVFGIAPRPGLADVLTQDITVMEAIHSTPLENLHIMPHGSLTSEPAELLESIRLGSILEEAKDHFDLVLIDAPPLLAVADPAIIAPLVDAVMLTVRVNKNGRRPVEHAVKLLTDIGISPVAAIVNGVDRSAQKSYGYGKYSKDRYGYVGKYSADYTAKEIITPQTGKRTLVASSTEK